MRPLRPLVLAIPVVAVLAAPLVSPAEAHRRHDGAALAAGLIGLGVGALAGNALAVHPDGYGPAYTTPTYVPPPAYGYAPTYAAPPPVVYAPPPVVYAPPPPIAYVAPLSVYAVPPRTVYAPPLPAYQDRPTYAEWGDD